MDAWNIYTTFLFGRQAWPNFQGQNSLLLDLKVPNSQNCQVDIRHHWIPCLDVATPVWLARPVASSSAQRCPLEEPDQDIPPVQLLWGYGENAGETPNGMGPLAAWYGRCRHGVASGYRKSTIFPSEFWGDVRIQRCWILRSREEPAGFSQEKRRLAGPWNKQRAVTPQNQWLVQMIPLLLGPWPIFRRRFAVSLREGNWWMPKISEAYRECEYSQAEWPVLQDLVGNVSMISRLMIKWWSVVDSETVWEI